MSGLRFTLSSLAVTVTIVALACGVLVGSAYCLAFLTLAVVGVHLTSVLGIIYRSTSSRAFWIGFAIFGWAYIVVAFAPEPLNSKLLEPTGVIGPIYGRLRRTVPVDELTQTNLNKGVTWGDEQFTMEGGKRVKVVVTGPIVHRTFHLLASLVFALIGGCIGHSFYRAPSTKA